MANNPEWIFEPCESDHPTLPYAARGARPAARGPVFVNGYGLAPDYALIDARNKARYHDAAEELEAAKRAIVSEMRMYSAARG